MSGLTLTYTRMHTAFRDAAHRHGLLAHDVRVLLAIYECTTDGSKVASDRIEELLAETGTSASIVRRSLGTLYEGGLVTGTSPRGGPRTRGLRTVLSLTVVGREAALAVVEACQGSTNGAGL